MVKTIINHIPFISLPVVSELGIDLENLAYSRCRVGNVFLLPTSPRVGKKNTLPTLQKNFSSIAQLLYGTRKNPIY